MIRIEVPKGSSEPQLHMAPRRVNADFTRGIAPSIRSESPSAFEIELKQLGLTIETCLFSPQLREWCHRNKNHVYIPEWLLKRWHMSRSAVAFPLMPSKKEIAHKMSILLVEESGIDQFSAG